MNVLTRLRRFAADDAAVERCSLCGTPLESRHEHLVERSSGGVRCACSGCALLFEADSGPFRRVPVDVTVLSDLRLSDGTWEALGIPVGLAWIRLRAGTVAAAYPSPLGVVESTVEAGAWERLVSENEAVGALKEDVEALLVRRTRREVEVFRVPIDLCYALAGVVRREWRGFSGGDEVWPAVDRFLADLRKRDGGAS